MSRTERRDRGEGGFTLVELLVVIVITGLVGSVVVSSVIRGMQVTARAEDRIQNLAELQRGMERVARELRVADPLLVATGDYGDGTVDDPATNAGALVMRDNDGFEYRYYLDASGEVLLEDVYDADTGTAIRTRTFIERIGNLNLPTPKPLFEYYDLEGNVICADYSTICTDNVAGAAQIRITLVRELQDGDPVEISTVVNVRRTRYLQ